MRSKAATVVDLLWPRAWVCLGALTIAGCASHPPETLSVHSVARLRPKVDVTQPPGSEPGWEESGKFVTVTRIPTPTPLLGLLYDDGAVWVAGKRFVKIDPASNGIAAEFKEASGCAVGIGEGWLWATKFGLTAHDLVRLDPKTGEVTARVSKLPHERGSPAVGEGSVWFHVAGKVLRIEPKTAEVVATIPTHGSLGVFAFGEGAVWVLEKTSLWPNAESVLLRIDPSRNQVTDTIHIGKGAFSIAVGEGAVWVVQLQPTASPKPTPGKLLRIEPSSLHIVRAIRLWQHPGHVVVAAGSVWIGSFGGSALVRVDPVTNQVAEMVQLPGPGSFGGGLAAGGGALWMGQGNGFSSGCVCRIDLTDFAGNAEN